jgi:hypothetical protein
LNKIQNSVIAMLLLMLNCGCTAKEVVKGKSEFSHLKIQTVLSTADKKYYKEVHNEINNIAKDFAYWKSNAIQKNCSRLEKMFDEISTRPFSKEREREREMIQTACGLSLKDKKYFYNLTEEEYAYLRSQLPESSVLAKDNDPKLFDKDQSDLTPYKYKNSLKAQYCKKAVETMQWDHIYYLAQVDSPGQLIGCLSPESKFALPTKNCCPEAIKLVLKGINRNALYDPLFLNPYTEPMDIEPIRKELRKVIFNSTGRDLDKE